MIIGSLGNIICLIWRHVPLSRKIKKFPRDAVMITYYGDWYISTARNLNQAGLLQNFLE